VSTRRPNGFRLFLPRQMASGARGDWPIREAPHRRKTLQFRQIGKRKIIAEISDGTKIALTSNRIKIGNSSLGKSSTQNTEDSGKGAVGSSKPQEMSMKYPVNIRNWIYAAEWLSRSLDITPSISFYVVRFGYRKSPAHRNSLRV
jgi:hypothetical protein